MNQYKNSNCAPNIAVIFPKQFDLPPTLIISLIQHLFLTYNFVPDKFSGIDLFKNYTETLNNTLNANIDKIINDDSKFLLLLVKYNIKYILIVIYMFQTL